MSRGTRVGVVAVVEEEALAAYGVYLRCERGVGEATVAGYEADARLLLCAWLGSGQPGVC